jgi:asparagine synthase (glutamine-hydrolysing)
MCGIAGLWIRTGCSDAELRGSVERMTTTLIHRGPDDAGCWCDGGAGAALGFRRLAVIDVGPTGHQPMVSSDGRFVIVFNGEIYNFIELKAELAREGSTFRGSSDTEVILEAAVRWGAEAAIPKLWGMFAIALWDRQERSLLLARDRLGKKPLYFAMDGDRVTFASELKAIRAVRTTAIDRQALAGYLRYGCVRAPATIYEAVSKLPPGSTAVLGRTGRFAMRRYWDGREVAQAGLAARPKNGDATGAVAGLDVLLRDAIRRRMVADVPLGAFLSGGIDSSLVVALAQAECGRAVRTFTLGFRDADYDEAPAARLVAAHLGTEHTELYVSARDALDIVPRLPDIYDEPFGDASQIPTTLIAALARRHITVALTGDGGDEVFGGYVRHVWASRIRRVARWWPPVLRRTAGRALGAVSPTNAGRWYRAVERGIPPTMRQVHPWEKLAKLARVVAADTDDEAYESLVSAWTDPALVLGVDARTDVASRDGLEASRIGSFAERMMLFDQTGYLPDDILVKVDRATMAAGLEARSPLLDHRLVEWAWHVPPSIRFRDGVGKWALRQLLARHVPARLVDRPKAGFGVPIGAWLRGPLRDWAESLLDQGRLVREGYLRPEPIRRVWSDHLAGRRADDVRLWTVLMFQAWLERWR